MNKQITETVADEKTHPFLFHVYNECPSLKSPHAEKVNIFVPIELLRNLRGLWRVWRRWYKSFNMVCKERLRKALGFSRSFIIWAYLVRKY